MKDRKSLYLLIFALIVVTVAITLISVWGYRFYFSKKAAQPILQPKKTNQHPALLNSEIQELNN
ncbi:MAG: hypothetical protein ACTHK0_11705, partial [Ginsengibacter sp.]